jgi:hypothetical protein
MLTFDQFTLWLVLECQVAVLDYVLVYMLIPAIVGLFRNLEGNDD